MESCKNQKPQKASSEDSKTNKYQLQRETSTTSTTEDSWSMCGDFICRHHEEHRLKFYDPDNETFRIPFKGVDVMRQTQTSLDSFSEHIINGIRTEAKGVNLSEEWTGTTRFQILCTRPPEGYKWVNERPTNIQKTTRPDGIWPSVWTQLSQKQEGT